MTAPETLKLPRGEQKSIDEKQTSLVRAAMHQIAKALGGGRSLLAVVAKRGGLVMLDQAVVSGTSFLTAVIIARACGTDGFGVFSLALSAVFLVAGVQASLITTPYTVYCHRYSEQRRRNYAGNSLWQFVGLASIVALLLVTTGVLLQFAPARAFVAPLLLALSAALPALLLREFVRRFAMTHFRLTTLLPMDIGIAAVQLGGLFCLAKYNLLTPAVAYLAIALSCFLAGLPALLSLKNQFKLTPLRSAHDLRRNWSFGRWLLGGQVTFLLTAYSIPWLLAAMCGTADTGLYGACMSVIMLTSPLVQGVCSYLGPQAAESFATGGVPALRQITRFAGGLLGLAFVLFTAVMLFAGEEIAVFVYGDAFIDSGLLIGILALAMTIYALGMVADIGVWAMRHPQLNFAANAAGMMVTVTLATLLIWNIGLLGAALASVAGNTTTTVIKFFAFITMCRRARFSEA